jgi:structural maintenance of chromosome 2
MKKKEEAIVAELRDKVENLSAQLSGLQFQFSDPEPNFDRSKVKGLVASLVDVKDPSATLALEVTAGGKLYNV